MSSKKPSIVDEYEDNLKDQSRAQIEDNYEDDFEEEK